MVLIPRKPFKVSEQNNMENNDKLIAEFMEVDIIEGYDYIAFYREEPLGVKCYELLGLRYSTSWDWLMPVIHEIELRGYVWQSGLRYSKIGYDIHTIGKDKLSATYESVVEFIKSAKNL